MNDNELIFPFIPITKETFERQEWEEHTDNDGEDEDGNPITFTYYILPLPKDNPDDNCPILISSADDEWEELGLKKGQYYVEVCDFFGLGVCRTEEELEILYRSLTKLEIETDTLS
tara:strand:+ start:81 stop:428 length:348 start_codon:yes stop_codon:yes gene_type:complete